MAGFRDCHTIVHYRLTVRLCREGVVSTCYGQISAICLMLHRSCPIYNLICGADIKNLVLYYLADTLCHCTEGVSWKCHLDLSRDAVHSTLDSDSIKGCTSS